MKHVIPVLTLGFCLFIMTAYAQTGEPDPTFGTAGKFATTIDSISYITGGAGFAFQSDGKLVAGARRRNTGTSFDIFARRFLADGGVDNTFGTAGNSSFVPIPGNMESLRCMAIQADDKILLGGGNTTASKQSFLIARLKADGGVDSSFGDNGYKIVPITVAGDDYATVIKVLSDGKILIGGRAGTLTDAPALVRLNADGSLDNTFGTGGISVTEDLGFFSYILDMQVQADGKIVTDLVRTTGTPRPFTVLRYNADGSKDNSFGTSGLATISFANHVYSSNLVLQADNKIVIGGSYTDPSVFGKQQAALARLNADGSPDNTFGTGGKVLTDIGFNVRGLQPVIQSSDNKILALGLVNQTNLGKSDFLMLRYLPNGAPDNEWGGDGAIEDSFATDTEHFTGNLFYRPDGKVFLAGVYDGGSAGLTYAACMGRYGSCAMTITTQPANVSIPAGNTATFTVAGSSPSAVYQWQAEGTLGWNTLSNGGQYAGVTTATLTISPLTAANNGQRFRVVGITGVCADTSDVALLTVTPYSGIGEMALAGDVRLYPNPVGSELVVDGLPGKVRLASVTVTDMLGKVAGVLRGHEGSQLRFDAGAWPSGMYFVLVTAVDGRSQVFKITKR
ncbi:T9SS type A sorting domain-containing protein [Taibaiella koreensis]|uniref:T9SS type A sorting domain-containing protein n=1 Tax=Taibaiella koreensis TaxID=1268548 RepID=UPI000E59A179|nr:T9SS type A sorting domain-containing protein [Taibaiella koreensis]